MSTRVTLPRRWRLLSVVALTNLVAVGLLAGPSQAQTVSLCNGTAEGLTIAGDLAVPAAGSCELVNVTVTGDVVVRADANLALQGSTVRGDLTIRSNGFAAVADSTVRGTTVLREAFGLATEDSGMAGVDARRSQFLFTERTDHGEVFSADGQTVILSGVVDGDLLTNRDLLTDVDDSVVTGAVRVRNAANGSVVCGSEVDGDAVFRGNAEVVQIGDGSLVDGCAFNVFGGRLVVRDNTAVSQIVGNVIRGNLVCDGNTPAPVGADNRLRGEATGQCAPLAPAGPALTRTLAPIAPEQRIAELRGQIEARTTAAASAVAQVGPAGL